MLLIVDQCQPEFLFAQNKSEVRIKRLNCKKGLKHSMKVLPKSYINRQAVEDQRHRHRGSQMSKGYSLLVGITTSKG